jgi:hypothetical protein
MLDDAEMSQAMAGCQVLVYKKPAILLHKGKINNNLYLVLGGQLTVHLDIPDEKAHIFKVQNLYGRHVSIYGRDECEGVCALPGEICIFAMCYRH